MKKVIVISGGSSGLGKSTAQMLAKDNIVVILADGADVLLNVAAEIGCESEVCDVTDAVQIDKTVLGILKRYGRIDVLINDAGLFTEGNIEDSDVERIKSVIGVNVIGTILLTRAVVPYMKASGNGLIVNVISQAGLRAKAARSIYTASKWAITGFTKSLQKELSASGVRVTGLYPGKINTPLFEHAGIEQKNVNDAMNVVDVAETIAFIVSRSERVVIPELGIRCVEEIG